MKKTERKTVSVEQDELVDVICNRCGETCRDLHEDGRLVVRGGNFAISGSYADAFPPDMERWSFDLCEPCLGWFVSTFLHYPSTSELSFAHGASEEGSPCEPRGWAFDLLAGGKTSEGEIPEWMIERYTRAMGKAVPPHLAKTVPGEVAKAYAATDLAARTLETETAKHWAASRDTWQALEAMIPPIVHGEQSRLDQVRAIVHSKIEDRVIARVRELVDGLRWAQSKLSGDDYMKNYELIRMTELFLASVEPKAEQ